MPVVLGRTLVWSSLVVLGVAVSAAACDGGSESTTGGGKGASGGSGGGGASGGEGGGGSGAGAGPPTLEIVPGAPAPPADAPETQHSTVEGYASAVGANASLVAIGTTTGVYEATPQGLTKLSVVGDEPDLPMETGAVRAIAPYAEGLLIAADNALFFTSGGVVQLSMGSEALHPLGISAITVRVADEDEDGDDDIHLTLLGAEGVYELSGTALTEWTITGETGAPTAAFSQKDRLYVAYGDRAYEVDKPNETAYPLVFDIGSVSAIACDSLACDEGSLLYLATDRGLVERGSDGGYSLFTLAAEGDPPVPAEAFAFDAPRQRLYAVAGDWVLRVRAGEIPEAVAILEKGAFPRRVAFDKQGDMWALDGTGVTSFALGTPLSFATDIQPIMGEYCAVCHAEAKKGAPKIDFESYGPMVEHAAKVIERIADGSMPPPGYQKMPKEKFQLLQDWAVGKAP
jgi:hypothetical protein